MKPQYLLKKKKLFCPNCYPSTGQPVNKKEFLERLNKKYPYIKMIGEYTNITTKTYFKCTKCNYGKNFEWYIQPIELLGLKNKKYCPHCNNIFQTDKWMIPYFINEDDCFKYKHNSSKKVLMQCLDCGDVTYKKIYDVYRGGYNCKICGNKTSYGERVLNCVLKQLGIEYIHQLSRKHFQWCDNYYYDFCIIKYKIIIEIDGKQHRQEKQKRIDRIKESIAKENGYTIIRIKYEETDFDYIKNNIINSDLSKILFFDKVDWESCRRIADSGIIKKVCEYYASNPLKKIREIAEEFEISRGTISHYL